MTEPTKVRRCNNSFPANTIWAHFSHFSIIDRFDVGLSYQVLIRKLPVQMKTLFSLKLYWSTIFFIDMTFKFSG